MINNLVSSITLLILDFAWIYFYMGNHYYKEVKKIQKNNLELRKIYAIFAYILMIIGLNIFVIPKIRPEKRLEDSLKYGFSFGLIIYGIYDMI